MQWHKVLVAMFVVGTTVYIVSNWNDSAGWGYVFILLVGAALLWPNFAGNLQWLGGNVPVPTGKPGKPF